MELSEQINEIIQNTKSLALDLEKDNKIQTLKQDFSNAAQKAVDHAAKYVIKAMPVPDAVKDILLDVKDALKTKDLKSVIETAVKSSVREGLEFVGLPQKNIQSIMDIRDAATKGGLITSLKNGVEIVANNFLKNNIVGQYVYDFFDKLKSYIMNKDFGKYLNKLVEKLNEKKQNFMKKCEEWYSAYKDMNLEYLNKISEQLDNNKYILKRYSDCEQENNIIQNMTSMINNKKAILTENQQRLCQVM